ncbi:MAG: mcpB 1, partial [Sporomusa sp.]|nr:mcpB 1 [Sporomusa sp.]
MKIRNIQTRLLLILLPMIFAVLGVLAGVSYYFSKESLAKSVNETALAVGADYANRVQADMGLLIAHLEDLASIPLISAGTEKLRIAQVLAETQTRLGSFDVLIFASPDGSGITSAGAAAQYGERDYFKKVLATKKPTISEPLISKVTGKMAVALAVPVTNNGKLTGVIIATFSMERLTAMVKDLKFLETGYGQITEDSGTIIAHPRRPDLVGKLNLLEKKINPELKLPQSELDDRLMNLVKTAVETGNQTRGIYSFVDSVERIAVATPIELAGGQRWVMMVAAPETEATQATAAL